MSPSSSADNTTQDGAELTSSLTAKKTPRTTTTRKKTAASTTLAAKKSTTPKSTAQKSKTKQATTTRKASTTTTSSTARSNTARRKTNATTTSSTAKRKTTTATTTKRTTVSLKADLKKLTGESYTTGDFTRGAIVLVEEEGVEILREALMVMLSSKAPLLGGMISNVALESLLGKVTDTYKKSTAADRKALRAVINWLRGDANTNETTQQHLVALLNGQPPTPPPAPTIDSAAPLDAADLRLKPLRNG